MESKWVLATYSSDDDAVLSFEEAVVRTLFHPSLRFLGNEVTPPDGGWRGILLVSVDAITPVDETLLDRLLRQDICSAIDVPVAAHVVYFSGATASELWAWRAQQEGSVIGFGRRWFGEGFDDIETRHYCTAYYRSSNGHLVCKVLVRCTPVHWRLFPEFFNICVAGDEDWERTLYFTGGQTLRWYFYFVQKWAALDVPTSIRCQLGRDVCVQTRSPADSFCPCAANVGWQARLCLEWLLCLASLHTMRL